MSSRSRFTAALVVLGVLQFTVLAVVLIGSSGSGSGVQGLQASFATPAIIDESPIEEGGQSAESTGRFVGNGPFTLSGNAAVSISGAGELTLAFSQDFSTNRGQELVVYLRAADGDFIDLGELQTFRGAQEFAVPDALDLSVYDEVQIWDEPFAVHLGSAFLS